MAQTTIATPLVMRERRVSAVRLFAAGCAAAAVVVLGGFAFELYRFGSDDRAAAANLRQAVEASFAGMTTDVERVAHGLSGDAGVRAAMASNPEADENARGLFDAASVAREHAADDASAVALTMYDNAGVPRAWAGRASDLPADRITGAATLFVTPTPLGLRLVYLEPIAAPTAEHARVGAVVVEHAVASASSVSPGGLSAYTMTSSLGPVSLRLPQRAGAQAGQRSVSFLIRTPDGAPLLEASTTLDSLGNERLTLRRTVAAIALAIFGATILLLAGPLLDRRIRARRATLELQLTAAIVAVVIAGAGLLWFAFVMAPGARVPGARSAARLCLAGATAAAVAAALVSAAVRLRVALRAQRRPPERSAAVFAAAQLAAGVLLAVLLIGFERVLGRSIDPAAVDLHHFSLHPWTLPRLSTLAGILFGHDAVLWFGALACVFAAVRWRLPRRPSTWHAGAAALWIAPTAIAAAIGASRNWAIPAAPIVLGAITCAVAGLVTPRVVGWYRRATVASRLLTLFMAFLLPALLVYPTVLFYSDRAVQQLIAAPGSGYAAQAMAHPQTLQERLKDAQRQIDDLPLPDLIASASDMWRVAPEGPKTDIAFGIWSQTVLARLRLTSDVEVYDAKGTLLSPFALNFPEAALEQTPGPLESCQWEVAGEAQSYGGAQERNTLHAQRGVCAAGRLIGAIVVHVVFDYRSLPFISSQSAYYDVLGGAGAGTPVEGAPAGDVEFVAYGWGLTTIYMSGRDSWPLDPDIFARVYKSRAPFWTVIKKGGKPYRVYFANDRQFIYALGYQIPGVFDHLVRLAELTTAAAAAYGLLLIGNVLFTWLARVGPQTGRSLLREIRASFYRKLFLAFVLASIVPVLTLAIVIRTYFAGLLFTDIQGEAARTAAVAQRVIEESETLVRRGTAEGVTSFGDDLMVWISQLINQDVNVFNGASLAATSERDLFASGLLPTRTPEAVYRAIVLQRLPSIVTEDRVGDVSYMLAAAPIRSGATNAALTVPLALRQHEVEREIDDLDRGIHLAALFFILLGAGIGFSMAERIADPIRQLTRATRHIARGDFDARIAVRSSDELRRLVDAFNGMAAELKAQRGQLEKTHRLEAWAEMARQVAHEIKNPLTPIQLSAEHLRRVHADRGEPMGPILEGCVTSILNQVHLLRQIAAEFSSFASSPTARRQPVDPVRLVHDVVDPYRAGLEGRIEIRNDVTAPLPPVLVDRTLASRALANVVENALHAMPGKGQLHLRGRAEKGWVVVEVEDTGVGMDEEALGRVFEPYFSTKVTGTGLGLPIAKRNIELSGGEVSVHSRKDVGTTVTIRLPVAATGVSGAER